MPEWLTVGPLGPILGVLVGGVITFALTQYFRSRKRVTFWIERGDNLTKPLKESRKWITLKIDDRELKELNRATVIVRNSGNVAVSDLLFEVDITTSSSFQIADVEASQYILKRAITLVQTEPSFFPTWEVKVAFLNPKEEFAVRIFYDGKLDAEVDVACRMPDLKTEIRRVGVGEGGKTPDLQKAIFTAIGLKSWAK